MLTPYKGVKYHLRETALAKLRPSTYQELFNLRHSSLRNAIKRIFSILKRRFKILNTLPEYSIDIQVKLILALIALYNFIRIHVYKDVFEEDELYAKIIKGLKDEHKASDKYRDKEIIKGLFGGFITEINEIRDTIAKQMWANYQIYLS